MSTKSGKHTILGLKEIVRRVEKSIGERMTFGSMLEAIRISDEVSQTHLAKKMGISRAHLCDIEKGRRTVTAERAAKFAKALGYSIPQFVAQALEDQLEEAGLKYTVKLEAA